MKKTKKDTWPLEQTRLFLQLLLEEKRKGNRTKTSMNKEGKRCIMETFEARFRRGFDDWNFYKNKYDGCRKKYMQFMHLTRNRTGLGYDKIGRIQMSDDWWSERETECPGIRKSACDGVPNMDLLEEEFGGVVVSATQGNSYSS